MKELIFSQLLPMATNNKKTSFILKLIVFIIVIVCCNLILWHSLGTDNPLHHHPLFLRKTTITNYDTDILTNFDWKGYLEMNIDVAIHNRNKNDAIKHYLTFGHKEGRPAPKLFPEYDSHAGSMKKLTDYLHKTNTIEDKNRSFVMIHIGDFKDSTSFEVAANNIIILMSAIKQDVSLHSKHFYWFNVVGGKTNGLYDFIDASSFNCVIAEWSLAPSDIYLHFRTLAILETTLTKHFGSIMMLNNGVRGPFTHREDGGWIEEYNRLLYENNVGMVGSTLSCEIQPHVQTHIFGIRSEIVPIIIKEYRDFKPFRTWPELIRHYEVDLTAKIQSYGYNVSSLLYDKRGIGKYFNGKCLEPESQLSGKELGQSALANTLKNPTAWCSLKAEEVIFMKWGGEALRRSGFVCDDMKQYMNKKLLKLRQLISHPSLYVPETLQGGRLFDLYKQYDLEMWRGQNTSHDESLYSSPRKDKVCFLVRTAKMHDVPSEVPLYDQEVFAGMDGFIRSLQRQTDDNWDAYFFITDNAPFTSRLKEILTSYQDHRLQYLHIPDEQRISYTKLDAGYTATDAALKIILQRDECRWISATNADNIYGSEVVQRVRHVELYGQTTSNVDMILAPINSRNFLYQDSMVRGELEDYDNRCKALISSIELSITGLSVQTRPVVGRVDLAAVFFSREKFAEENLFFGNFTDPVHYPCSGCQDGYLTEHLARKLRWSYLMLPIDGLRSLVFHGPSPLWCLASGNIWFDHKDVNQARCYSQQNIDLMRLIDNRLANRVFDWTHFDDSNRLCVRFSQFTFSNYDSKLDLSQLFMI